MFTIEGPRDAQSSRQLARPGEVRLPAIERLGRANEHCFRLTRLAGNNVKHFVDAVNQIDICMPAHPEHHFGALRAPARSVAGQIMRTYISLCFHDACAAPARDNDAPELYQEGPWPKLQPVAGKMRRQESASCRHRR